MPDAHTIEVWETRPELSDSDREVTIVVCRCGWSAEGRTVCGKYGVMHSSGSLAAKEWRSHVAECAEVGECPGSGLSLTLFDARVAPSGICGDCGQRVLALGGGYAPPHTASGGASDG